MAFPPAPLPETPAAGAAPPDPQAGPVIKVPLSEDRQQYFRKEIERARQLREDKISAWQAKENLVRYEPPDKSQIGVNVGVDFRDVERKGADLFFGPAVISIVADPEEGDPRAAILHQDLINGLLSDQKMDAKSTADKAVLDCLLTIQPAFTKWGYVPTTVDVPNPATGLPTPVVVHETLFFSRISQAGGLIPVDFKDTDYDAAPWLGYDWKMPVSMARREFGLPPGWEPPSGTDRKTTFTDDRTAQTTTGASDPHCSGTTLYYYAYLIDEAISHPQLIRELVVMDGWEGPVKHQNLECQTLGPDGRLTPDSIVGYPLHLLALRDLPDSQWVPADSSLTGPLTKEINTYMDQAKAKRDSNRLILLTDAAEIDTTVNDAINASPQLAGLGAYVLPVKAGALARGADAIMKQVPALSLGRETYDGCDRFERHREQILGIGANQGGGTTPTRRSATETAEVAKNSSARFEKERKRVIKWWLKGIRNKLSPFVIRYGDRLAMEILGAKKGAEWVQFRDAGMLGPFTFSVSIDSGKYQDIEDTRRQKLQLFNMLAKAPGVNQEFLLGEICDTFGWDRSKALRQPEPPKPPPPSVSLTFSGTDFAQPQAPICLSILQAQGVQVNPQAVASTQALLGIPAPPTPSQPVPPGSNVPIAHGGPAPQADRIDQHTAELTGGIQNAPTAQGVM